MSNRRRGADARSTDRLVGHAYIPATVAAGKRISDILMAAFALLLTAPIWPLIALAIRLDSRGPVLFRQMRVGRVHPDRVDLFSPAAWGSAPGH